MNWASIIDGGDEYGWYLQWCGAIFPIFCMGYANNLVGIGRNGFCQGVSFIFKSLIPLARLTICHSSLLILTSLVQIEFNHQPAPILASA